MSDIVVNVTNAGAANISVSSGSTINATVGSGGSVNVSTGMVSPGNATVLAGTVVINSTTTLASGSNATVVNNGTAYAALLDFGIPAGPYSNITVGDTKTLSAGSNATVTATTSGQNVTLNFGIPAGADGTNGTNGTNGVTPFFSIGNVTTLSAGSSANVTLATANGGQNVTLSFGLPQGAAGTNITLSSATPSNLGTASAGVSNDASRADHVHALPVIAYGDLSGVPSNFPTNTTLVSGLNTSYADINHSHNYVTSLNNLTGSLSLVAGSNVTVSSANSTITISASGGGLDSNAAVDGGNYVGETLYGITYTTQPQSQTVSSSTTVNLTTVVPNLAPTTYDAAGVFALNSLLYAPSATWSSGSNQATAAMLVSADNGATFSVAETYGYMSVIDDNPVAHLGLTKPVFAATNGTRTVYTTGFWAWNNSYINTMARYTDSANITTSPASTPLTGAVASASGVAYGAGRFVAAVVNGFNVELYSATDGVNWTLRHTLSPAAFGSLVFGAGQFYFRTYDQGISRSADGISWTSANESGTSIAASGSRAVIVNNTTTARYTTNGTTWLSATLPVACSEVSYAAGLFWAFAATSGTDVCTSPDGITWTLRTLPVTATWIRAAAAGGAALVRSSGANFAQGATVSVPASANLTVSATAASGTPVSYQWQTSVDAGSSWSNVASATSSLLTLSGLTQVNNGTRYRTLATANGAVPAYSQSAILTVTG